MGAAPADPWIRVRSANFELFSTAGERSARDLIGHFEQVHSFFEQAFGFGGSGRAVRIIAFRSAKEFQRYESNKIADAFFRPGAGHDYIVMKSGAADNNQVAVHEYTHLYIRRAKSEIPVWLDEGLAELYSNLQPRGAQIIVGMVIPGRADQLARGKWVELRTVVSARRNSLLFRDKAQAAMFYAESWALVHMLSLDAQYSKRLKSLMDSLDRMDSAAAIEKTYGRPIEEVERDLRAYLQNERLSAAVFDVKLPGDAAVRVETGACLPARLALAELVAADPGRLSEARAAYQQVARDYPNRWEAERGMGEFLARERRDREAIPHFLRAAQLGCQEPEMWVEYARSLAALNRSEDALRALREAVRLGPGLDIAHFELAVLLVRTGSFHEGIEEFRRVKRLPPVQAPRYYYNLAYAHYRVGETAQARTLVEKGRPFTHNPDELERLNQLAELLNGPEGR